MTLRLPTRGTGLPMLCVLASLLIALPASAFGLASESTWGGTGADTADGVAVAPDGSIYFAATSFGFGSPAPSMILLKYDATGTLIWERGWEVAGQFASDDASELAVAPDGSIYVVGGSGSDVAILKFAPDGSLVWQRTWGGETGVDVGDDVAIAPDGTVVVGCSTRSFGVGEEDVCVLKLDAAGNLLWQATWGTVNVENDAGIAVGADGTVYLTSTTLRPSGLFEFSPVLVRFDAAGNLLSQTAVSAGETLDNRGGVEVAPDGSVLVAGGIQEPASGGIVDLDIVLLRFTATGTFVSGRRWGGKSGDDPSDLVIAADGTTYIAGTTDSFGQGGGGDAVVIAVAPDGKGLDASTWGSIDLDRGASVALQSDGTVVLGATASAPPYVLDRTSMKVGRLRATSASFAGSVTQPTDILVDPGGVVFVPGGSTTFAGDFDTALVRLTP